MSGMPSYVSGVSDEPLQYRSVGGVLSDAAREWPETEALVGSHQSMRWTYRERDRRVTELARGLLAMGLRPGDREGIWSTNNAEWILTQFATARAGMILVNITPAYRASELSHALRKVGCRGLIMALAHKSANYIAILQSCEPFPDLEYVIHLGPGEIPGMRAFRDLLAPADQTRLPVADPDE